MTRMVKILLLVFLFTQTCYAADCDPFTSKCRQSSNALTKYMLSELHMVGTITKDNHVWAIIKTPNNHVYSVSTGNPIGIEGGHVSEINSQHVTIQGKNIETLWLQSVG